MVRRKKTTKHEEVCEMTLEEIHAKFERTRSGSLHLSSDKENKNDQKPDWWNNVGEKPSDTDNSLIADVPTNCEQPSKKIIADSPTSSGVVASTSSSGVANSKLVRKLESKLMWFKNKKTKLEKNLTEVDEEIASYECLLYNAGRNQFVIEDLLTTGSLNPLECQKKTVAVKIPDFQLVEERLLKMEKELVNYNRLALFICIVLFIYIIYMMLYGCCVCDCGKLSKIL